MISVTNYNQKYYLTAVFKHPSTLWILGLKLKEDSSCHARHGTSAVEVVLVAPAHLGIAQP